MALMIGPVAGRTPRQSAKASAACSTSMPTPSASRPAPACLARRRERRQALAVGQVIREAPRREHGWRHRGQRAGQAGRGGVHHQVERALDPVISGGVGCVFAQRPQQVAGLGECPVGQGEIRWRRCQEGPDRAAGRTAGTEHEHTASFQLHAEIVLDIAEQANAVEVEAPRPVGRGRTGNSPRRPAGRPPPGPSHRRRRRA